MAIDSVRVSTRPTRQILEAAREDGKYAAVQPNPALYGIYGQQYAANLAKQSDSAALNALNAMALRNRAEEETQAYREALAAANAVQEKLQLNDQTYGLYKEVGGRGPEWMDRGVLGVENVEVDPVTGRPRIAYDPVSQVMGNQNTLNNDQAERVGTYATAIDTLRKSGVTIPDQYLGELLTPPGQTERVPVTSGSTPVTPSDATERYKADEGMTVEQQLELQRLQNEAKKKGDRLELSIVTGTNGVAQITAKGTPEALERNGYDPVTGVKINPNAGAAGGDAPANPAATSTSAKTSFNLGAAVSIGNQYGTVTSTMRNKAKNRKVGGAEKSYHLTGRAIDIARRKGVKHEQIEQAYKSAGYKLIESIDEGDHSHFAFGTEPAAANINVYVKRLQSHPSVADVQVLDDGRILVTTKSGKNMVVKDGKVIG